jgi:hypothetical protein
MDDSIGIYWLYIKHLITRTNSIPLYEIVINSEVHACTLFEMHGYMVLS